MKNIVFLILRAGQVLSTNPCPSTKCWNFDSDNDVCNFVDDGTCHSLSCTEEKMSITLAKEVFEIPTDNNGAFAKPDGDDCKPSWDGSQWSWEKSLGTCGMEVDPITVNNQLFVKFVSTFSRTVLDKVDLNGISVQYSIPAQVAFTCNYNAEILIGSSKFTVEEPEDKDETIEETTEETDPETGETTQKLQYQLCKEKGKTCEIGHFSSAFVLDLGLGEDHEVDNKETDENVKYTPTETIYVGSRICPKIKWDGKPAGLSMIKFYLNEISFAMAGHSIKVVDKNCYSKTLGARRIDDSAIRDNDAEFCFTSLSLGDSSALEQKSIVSVSIRLCVENAKNECSYNKETKDCPGRDADGNDIDGFHYTVDGL